MLFGVNEKRLWEGVLYANVGALKLCKNRTLFGEGISKWALGAGMINEFKVCKEASIVVDMEAIAVKARAFSTTAGRLAIFPTITVGLSYNLGEIF